MPRFDGADIEVMDRVWTISRGFAQLLAGSY